MKHIYCIIIIIICGGKSCPQKAVIHVVKTFASGGKVPLWLGCGPWSGQKLERHLRPTLYSPPRSGSPMSQLTLIHIYSQKARLGQTEYNYNNTDGFPLYQAHIICTVQCTCPDHFACIMRHSDSSTVYHTRSLNKTKTNLT